MKEFYNDTNTLCIEAKNKKSVIEALNASESDSKPMYAFRRQRTQDSEGNSNYEEDSESSDIFNLSVSEDSELSSLDSIRSYESS